MTETTRRTFRALRELIALAAVLAFAQPAAAQETLPPGVVARVHGRDIREADLLERLAQRWGGTERGKQVLDQLVDDTCVEIEAAKRGVTVTDSEVTAYVQHVDETIRKQTGNSRTIEDIYKDQHSNPREFALIAREYLKRQKMATEDLGAKPGEEVPEARLKLWLSSLRRRVSVKLSGLPDGVLAQVGETVIDRPQYARALKEHLPEQAPDAARADLIMEAATDHALGAAKIAVTDAEVEAEIAKLRARFASDPRVKGTGATFDEFLKQARGTSEAELRGDRGFRASIGMNRMLSARISEADVKKQWDDNRDAYGERALVREIYVAAQEEGGAFQMRNFKDAQELTLRAKTAVLEGAGQLGIPNAPKRPLGEVFTAVAKQFEGDKDKRQAAGEPSVRNRVSVEGDHALAKAVFEGEIGVLQGPIRSRVGWHLVIVDERRPAPSYDEVKDRVREDLLRREIARFQLEVRADPGVILR